MAWPRHDDEVRTRLLGSAKETTTVGGESGIPEPTPKVEHAARGPKARSFGPARARHGPILTGPGPARSTLRAVLGPTPRPAGRHGTLLTAGTVSARYEKICET